MQSGAEDFYEYEILFAVNSNQTKKLRRRPRAQAITEIRKEHR